MNAGKDVVPVSTGVYIVTVSPSASLKEDITVDEVPPTVTVALLGIEASTGTESIVIVIA